MNPLLRIREQIAQKKGAASGVVVSADGDVLRVRTVRGTVSARGAFKVGDSVLVRDGVVLGRVAAEESIPVYRV